MKRHYAVQYYKDNKGIIDSEELLTREEVEAVIDEFSDDIKQSIIDGCEVELAVWCNLDEEFRYNDQALHIHSSDFEKRCSSFNDISLVMVTETEFDDVLKLK